MKALSHRFACWALGRLVRVIVWVQLVAIEDGHDDIFLEALELELGTRALIKSLQEINE